MTSHAPDSTPTILVAEDEPLMLKMLTYCLQKEGYRVVPASDGRQALDYLKTSVPDLVLTDLMMPYHSGLEVVEFVKQTLNVRIPVIVLSAVEETTDVEKAFQLGADDFTTKPFRPAEFIGQIQKHLGRSHAV
ncbi:response regulator transcription factor [Larkinella soli]|uniref:response regulator transcription factor n=1 Tax=Larkinella soli TaxID=1770527 RepID=UPI000FFC308C|nr:response regulator transcription factor [Larkinella soli]